MSERTLALPGQLTEESEKDVKEITYWGAVRAKLLRDKITIAAFLLGTFIVTITLAASLIAIYILGHDPTDTNLRQRNDPPTWAEEAWPKFQEFTQSCQGDGSCAWSLWPGMFSTSAAGLGQCWTMTGAYFSQARKQKPEVEDIEDLKSQGLLPPTCNWFGTDDAGRDVLTRGIYGGRISLRIGAFVAAIGMTLGVIMGLLSGYFAATLIDHIINAVIMLLGSIPLLFFLIILVAVFPFFRTPFGLSFLLGIFGWMGLSRLLRGQLFSIREREYILASRAVGASIWRIMFRHMLPNVSSIIIVIAIFDISGAIIAEAGLSYLGVGIGPPNPSWGNMMQGSLGSFTSAPWLVLTPGLFIFLTTLSIYLVGDGLRDALDPWLKNE